MNITLNGPTPAISTTGLPQVRQTPRLKFGGGRYFLNEILPALFSTTSLARTATTSANGLPLNAWQIRQWHRNLAFGDVCTSNEQALHSQEPRSGNDVSAVICCCSQVPSRTPLSQKCSPVPSLVLSSVILRRETSARASDDDSEG